jgi:(p)ppGpp synthase/HD superfamily hydrolase
MANVAMPLVHRALRRALKLHRKQDRDGAAPLPYFSHPVEVLNILRYEGKVVDEEMLAAAVLHDAIEETGETVEKIEKKFGPRVAQLVKELTREEPERTGLSAEEVWQVRTDLMLAEIDRMSPEAQAIKMADRISNLRCAKVTRPRKDYLRYIAQSRLILQHIPPSSNHALRRILRKIIMDCDAQAARRSSG